MISIFRAKYQFQSLEIFEKSKLRKLALNAKFLLISFKCRIGLVVHTQNELLHLVKPTINSDYHRL
jgi:hypothetical protein